MSTHEPERLAMITIPKRLAYAEEPVCWDSSRCEEFDRHKRAIRRILERVVGLLPDDSFDIVDWGWDMNTRTLRVVLSHPRFRPFKDGDVLPACDAKMIKRNGWESIMEK